MDEHLGLTNNIAAQLLHKTHFHQLIQDDATRDGAVQRLHNILVQFPALLASSATPSHHVQNNVFRSMETVMRIISQLNEDAWSSILASAPSSNTSNSSSASSTSSSSSFAHPLSAASSNSNWTSLIYLLALAFRIISLKSNFTTNQQSHIDEWTIILISKLSQLSPSTKNSSGELTYAASEFTDEFTNEAHSNRSPPVFERLQATAGYRIITDHISSIKRDFIDTDPFAHMQMASFQLAGVKQADVASSTSSKRSNGKKKDSVGSSSSSSSPDIPFFFLPRTKCSSCGRSQPFYCTHCYQVIHPLAQGKLPRVQLPLQLDIILHSNVIRSKSTALQSILLVETKEMIREFTFPGKLPQYDPSETAVIFPSDNSISLYQLAEAERTKMSQTTAGTPAAAAAVTGDASENPSDQLTLSSLRRVVFLEGTWSEAALMLQHPSLRHLTHIRLDFKAHSIDDSSTGSMLSPITAFWRYQRFGRGFLSSIEAIYHLFHQYCHVRSLHAGSDSANVSIDNLLWLFAMSHKRLRQFYQRQPQLLTPSSSSSD